MYIQPQVKKNSNEQVHFRATKFEKKLLEELADEMGLTVSSYCRLMLLENGLTYSKDRRNVRRQLVEKYNIKKNGGSRT